VKSTTDIENCYIAMFVALYNIACDYGNLYSRYEAEEFCGRAMELAKEYLMDNHALFNKISVMYQELFGEIESNHMMDEREHYEFYPGFVTETV
jgi:hypothetical protein